MNFLCLFLFFVTIRADVVDFKVNDDDIKVGLLQDQETKDENTNKDKTDPQKLDFDKPYYVLNEEKQKLKKEYKIPFNVQMNQEIKVKGDFKITDVEKSGMEEYFSISIDKVKVSVDTKSDVPLENLKEKSQIILLLEFIPEKKDDTIRTMLIMFLQDKPAEKPEKIIFEKSSYKINAFSEYTGLIAEFVAKLDKNDGKSVIKYSLETDKKNLNNTLKVEEQTGVLEITKALTPGTYNFKISAKIDTGIHGEADVILVVDHIVVCNAKNPKFPYSQLIKHIAEGTTGEIISSATSDDKCVYKITSQKPEGDYFKLDEKTGALTMVKEIKRDSELFKDTHHPKFIIKLHVDCGTATKVAEQKDDQHPNSEHYFNIPYNPVEMVLIIVIDKADNTPIFNTDKILVGYPRKYDIITQYGPPRVTSVAPFVGEKDTSSLKYSIVEENCPFSIDPVTGNVYPLSYYNKDGEYSFTVQAKDVIDIKDGKAVTKEGKLAVLVKFLTLSQIVEVFFIEETLDNFNKLLQEYNSNLDIEIKSLVHAVVPVTNEQRQSNEALSDKKQIHLLRALCYALDKKEHTVVKGEIIVDKLKTSSSVFSIQILENKKTPDSKGRNSSNSFMLTTSIFSVILALGVIVTIFYLVYMRRRNIPVIIMRRNGNTRSSVTALEDDMEAPSQTRWIGPHASAYSSFPNPTFDRTQRVSYSDTTGGGEVILMQNNAAINSNNFLGSSVSSFKPDSGNENFSSNDTADNIYRDLEFPVGNAVGSSSSSNIPVLDVTSLPPSSEQQWRKRTNTDGKESQA
ncbi:uncharacterized protein LOC135832464 [Planococcus citri]|uniref:uncharacterized protein LOC135832464 n=1 Tax=Planococcus citri TaxID=170843 RepID=UPI0031F9BCFC